MARSWDQLMIQLIEEGNSRLGAENFSDKRVLLESGHDDTVAESIALEIGRTSIGDTLGSEFEDVVGTWLIVA
jgi:hypothetical protein